VGHHAIRSGTKRLRDLFPGLLAVGLAAVVVGCGGRANVVQLDRTTVPVDVVERGPYLPGVTDTSAVVRWTTIRPTASVVEIRSDSREGARFGTGQRTRNHVVRLEGLEPGVEYAYRIRLERDSWSRELRFRTLPSVGSCAPFEFLVFGDSGTWSRGQLELAEHLNRERPLFVVHVGDVAYPAATRKTLTDKFFAVYRPLLARAAVFPVAGNHDVLFDGGEAFEEGFRVPGEPPPTRPFAIEAGTLAIFGLNSSEGADAWSLREPGSKQVAWLEERLAGAADDPRLEWLAIALHHPLYSAATGMFGYGSHPGLQRTVGALVDRHDVAFVFAGHDHDYQRSRPIRDDEVVDDERGTVHYVTGGGGGLLAFREPGSAWFTAVSSETYHYLRVLVDGSRVVVEAIGVDGEPFDRYETERPASACALAG